MENQLLKIDVDRDDVKRLKAVLYTFINKPTNFWHRPGQYKTRFCPNKAQMRSGSTGTMDCIKTLRKHVAMIKSLNIIKTEDIHLLDTPVTLHGKSYVLRSFLIELTHPLVSTSQDPAPSIFHSMDLPSSGQDHGKGIVYFTAYHAHLDLAECLVAILPAFIQERLGTVATKAWFHPGALEEIGDVTFHYDDAGNWNRTWTTSEDELAQEILDKDISVTTCWLYGLALP